MRKQKTDLQIKKDEIRRQILEKRNNLSSKEVDKKSELIIENLAPYLKNAQNIMIFMMKKYWILLLFQHSPLIIRKIELDLVAGIMTLF